METQVKTGLVPMSENPPVQVKENTEKKRIEKTFLVMGPTHSGKSSIINTFSKQEMCPVGKNTGVQKSTNIEINAYQFNLDDDYSLQFIDTIGYFDFDVKYSNEKIGEMIMELIVSGQKQIEVRDPKEKEAHDQKEKEVHYPKEKEVHDPKEKEVHDQKEKEMHDPKEKEVHDPKE